MSVNRRGIHAPVICTTSPPRLHLASSHTENFESPAVCLPGMNKHPASDRKTVTRTQPIMLQVYSRRAHIFYRGSTKITWFLLYRDSRVSYTISLCVMLPSENYPQESAACQYMQSESKSNLEPFIPPPLECFPNRRFPSRIPIVGKGGCRWLGLRVGLWGGLGGVFQRCVEGGGGRARVLRISFWSATFVLRVK